MATTTAPPRAGAPVGAPPVAAPPARPRRRRQLAPLWLISPAGVVILAVTVAPIVFLVFTSFTDYDQRSLFTGAYDSVGLGQYQALLADAEFWRSLLRTVLFTAAMVGGSVVIGMGVSHLLTRLSVGMRYTVTVVLIFAWAMPNVASSIVWKWMFQPGYGVVNWLLTQVGVFGDMTNVDWGNDAGLAYTSIWMLIVWQAVPFIALTLYAAETQIPLEYKEAARLDGASELRVYRQVTLVFLRPTLLLVTILSVIWDFNVFNQIWLVSAGGPDGATSTLGVFTYVTAFVGFDIGRGSAISVVTTALLALLTAFYIRNLVRSGEDL
ncbi:N,N'-diacetylchitobiose transport system permease protein [Frigoribacterium sp. PhB160]|uniref:carbohydrate ABC transporter permease n=1 Tax=Frigoribacterium sp. PhB160 TaxID=2485192 RepID=UPI000F492A44|nr:sugar ABC transporter permease [Frigoribacterium sp. PhB160]ROS59093.1 N,N'-diacetylchitobiose transport system permease protein [Frigoribacterium sp. PhB160]